MAEPLDLHPPMKSPILEAYEKAPKPRGFEKLSAQTCINIMAAAGIDYSDYQDFKPLNDLPIDKLKQLRDSKDYFGIGGGYYYTTPDHCRGIRNAMTERMNFLQEAAHHSGGNIPNSEEAQWLVRDIAESQRQQHPDIDSIFQAELPQVPEDQRDSAIEWIVGRFAGPDMNVANVYVDTPMFSEIFYRQQQTQFVRYITRDGKVWMKRWKDMPQRIQEVIKWEDLDPIQGLTVKEFIKELEGKGDSQMPENQQFENERKKVGGARKTHWPADHFPQPTIIKK
jgi:hypothetical protein